MTTGSEKLLLIREKYELVELVVNSEEVLDRSRQRAKGKAFFDCGVFLSRVAVFPHAHNPVARGNLRVSKKLVLVTGQTRSMIGYFLSLSLTDVRKSATTKDRELSPIL